MKLHLSFHLVPNKAKRFANHTADQCYQCLLASVCFYLFPRGAINAAVEQSDHHQEELQCSLVNCLRWSAVKKPFSVLQWIRFQNHWPDEMGITSEFMKMYMFPWKGIDPNNRKAFKLQVKSQIKNAPFSLCNNQKVLFKIKQSGV